MSYTKPISYSGLKTFRTCPRKFEEAYIKNNRGKPSPKAQRGTDLHAEIEAFFIRGSNYPHSTKALAPWRRFMETLVPLNPSPEAKMAVDKYWEPVEWDDPAAYYRGMADLKVEQGGHLDIYDWKSGRIYPDHKDQGFAYAALSAKYDSYTAWFVYLDLPLEAIPYKITAEQRQQEIEKTIGLIESIRTMEEFQPLPSREACKYCHVSWRNGGSCRAAP